MRKNISILSTDFSKDNGGIQNWMYYTKKLLNDSLGGVNSYSYKQDSFYKYLKSLMSDVFFLSTWKQVIFILPSCLTGTKKIFVFVHGSELLNINSILKYVFVFLLNRRNTYFIANSNAIGELFLKVTDRNIDFVQYPFACYSKLLNFETNDTHSTIGFFSICRLDKRKNIGNTILALKKIMNNKGLKFNYTIAGSGSEHESLERLIKCNNLQDNIRLVGRVSDKEKNTLFMNNDYFLMPAIFAMA